MQALEFTVSGIRKVGQVPGWDSHLGRGKGRLIRCTVERKMHQNHESVLEVLMRLSPHSPELQRKKEKGGPGTGGTQQWERY